MGLHRVFRGLGACSLSGVGGVGVARQAGSARAGQLSGLSERLSIASFLDGVAGAQERPVAHEHVQVLAFHDLRALLIHLLGAQVWQKVGHAEHRVGRVVADVHLHHLAVGFGHDAVKRQRQRRPLVVLYAAVVVRVQQREVVRLVQRILLDVEARRVDVRPQDVHALGDRCGPHMYENDGLALGAGPQLAARAHRRAGGDAISQRIVAGVLSSGDGGRRALALGLVLGDEIDVVDGQRLKLVQRRLVVLLPSHFAFHVTSFLECVRSQYEPICGEKFGNCYILFS